MSLLKRIESIKTHLGDIDGCRAALANELLYTKTVTFWKNTMYGSWNKFCSECIGLSRSSIYVYLKTAELSETHEFSLADMQHIIKSIGWERFKIGLTKTDDSQTVSRALFIEWYHDVNLNERVVYEESESELVPFSFHIPQDAADTLNNALMVRGMRFTNKTRSNLSSAMVKLINDLVEEEDE